MNLTWLVVSGCWLIKSHSKDVAAPKTFSWVTWMICQLFYFPSRSETWKWNKTGRQKVFGLRVKVAPYMMVWVPICPPAASNTGSNSKLFYLQEDSHTVLCFHDREQNKKVYTLTALFANALPQTCLIINGILALIWLIFNIMHVCKRRKQLLKSPQCYLGS